MPVYATEKKVEAVAYELSEQFFKRVGGGNSLQDVDELAEQIAAAIRRWLTKRQG